MNVMDVNKVEWVDGRKFKSQSPKKGNRRYNLERWKVDEKERRKREMRRKDEGIYTLGRGGGCPKIIPSYPRITLDIQDRPITRNIIESARSPSPKVDLPNVAT